MNLETSEFHIVFTDSLCSIVLHSFIRVCIKNFLVLILFISVPLNAWRYLSLLSFNKRPMLLLLAGLRCAVALFPSARLFIRVFLLSSLLLFPDSIRFFFSTSSFELSHFLSFQFDSIRFDTLYYSISHISHISQCVTIELNKY